MSDLDKIVITTPDSENILTERERAALIKKGGEDCAGEVAAMIEEAEKAARPLSLYAVAPIDAKLADGVVVAGVEIKSALMRENFDKLGRVFPYITTCGPALEDWSLKYKDDPLSEYFADEIKKIYLGKMQSYFHSYIKGRYGVKSHLSAMNPGSIKEWPLDGQNELFAIFGREHVLKEIGVTLTDSLLMLPSKTVSGIDFENETGYENCTHCPILNCPGRRAKSELKV